jgi:hypothetical protein
MEILLVFTKKGEIGTTKWRESPTAAGDVYR